MNVPTETLLLFVALTAPIFGVSYFICEPVVRRHHALISIDPWINEWIERGYQRERFVTPALLTLTYWGPIVAIVFIAWLSA